MKSIYRFIFVLVFIFAANVSVASHLLKNFTKVMNALSPFSKDAVDRLKFGRHEPIDQFCVILKREFFLIYDYIINLLFLNKLHLTKNFYIDNIFLPFIWFFFKKKILKDDSAIQTNINPLALFFHPGIIALLPIIDRSRFEEYFDVHSLTLGLIFSLSHIWRVIFTFKLNGRDIRLFNEDQLYVNNFTKKLLGHENKLQILDQASQFFYSQKELKNLISFVEPGFWWMLEYDFLNIDNENYSFLNKKNFCLSISFLRRLALYKKMCILHVPPIEDYHKTLTKYFSGMSFMFDQKKDIRLWKQVINLVNSYIWKGREAKLKRIRQMVARLTKKPFKYQLIARNIFNHYKYSSKIIK